MPATAIAPIHSNAKATISEDQVRFFVDQGYLVVPNLVSAAEVDELRQDMIRLARGHYPCEQIKPQPVTVSDQQVLENLLCIHQPHFISPVMKRFCLHAGIADVLSRIIAAHLPHWDGAVKCMQSMLFVKPPGKPGQAWHQDEMYIPTRDRSLCGAWIAMDDATIENGCLWVVPGSHRNGYIYPNRAPTDLDEYDGSPQCFGFDEAQAVPVEVKAGSVVFFNGYLLHKSLKNRAQIYRRALVNHYMNAWSLLPWHVKDGQSAAQADSRAILPTAGTDPYAWKGIETPPNQVYLRGFGKKWENDKAAAALAKAAEEAKKA